MNQSAEVLFKLVRIALGNEGDSSLPNVVNWQEVYDLSLKQGVGAVACDGMLALGECGIDEELRYKWMGQSMVIEQGYVQHQRAIADLAYFYEQQGIRMMLLKGYGLSLNYPIPEHRPSGDIDVFLLKGEESGGNENMKIWKIGDVAVKKHLGIKVDKTHEHHTVFQFEGQTIENHYDIINTKGNRSNRFFESALKKLLNEDSKIVNVLGQKIAIPNPIFNAIFIIRHMGQHFAGSHITLRHLLDWSAFIEKNELNSEEWARVVALWTEMGLLDFVKCINSICVRCFGLSAELFRGQLSNDTSLESRVLNDILCPEFSEKKKNNNLFYIVKFKMFRFYANRWKRKLVYKEGIVEQFIWGTGAHLLRLKTIKE